MRELDLTTTVAGIRYDAHDGVGNVPDNAEVEYLGFVALMMPLTYLSLAAGLDRTSRSGASIGYVQDCIRTGKPLAQSRLKFDIEGDVVRTSAHDGRHRMTVVSNTVGNQFVPVHLYIRHKKASHLSDSIIERIREGAWNEEGTGFVGGPLFGDAMVHRRLVRIPDSFEWSDCKL